LRNDLERCKLDWVCRENAEMKKRYVMKKEKGKGKTDACSAKFTY
jgi:hypothetical protein